MFIFLALFMLYSTWGVYKAAKGGMVRLVFNQCKTIQWGVTHPGHTRLSFLSPLSYHQTNNLPTQAAQHPMFSHYYRTSENETTNSSVRSSAPSSSASNFTSFSAFASRQSGDQGGGHTLGGGGNAGVSNMEAGKGKGYRLGGGSSTAGPTAGGTRLGGAPQPPARAASGGPLLGGTMSSSSSSSSGAAQGKGYKLGSK